MLAENANRTFMGLRCCCCSAGNTLGETREEEGGPQALGPSGPAQRRLLSAIPTPGKHSWRVLEAPGSPVVSEMLLASRSQAGSISEVLSG